MDLKAALSKLKTQGSGASLPFFFCEADAKGKPVVLVGPVTADAKAKVLAGAKSKKTAIGKMSITGDGDLHLKAKGPALSAMTKGMTVAALNAGARGLFKAVVTGAVEEEGEEEEAAQEAPVAPKSAEVKPVAPVSQPVKSKPAVPPAKKFPDVLRKSPEMAKLLDERQVLLAQLDEARKKPGATVQDLEPAAKAVAAVEAKLEAAQKKLNATGLSPQAMRPEYLGEDKKVVWNADSSKPKPLVLDPQMTEEEKASAQKAYDKALDKWKVIAESDLSVRRNFTDEEKRASAMSVDAEGRIVDASGKPVDTRKGGGGEYVTDAETGTMHRFAAKFDQGKKVANPVTKKEVPQTLRTHHSSVLSGKEVGGAGGIKIVDGEVQEITNVSGHYKPGVDSMVQTVEALLKQGALLNQKWVDKDGQPLTGKVADLHKGVLALQKQVAKTLKADPAADVAVDRAKIDKALAALAKLGAGPANKIKPAKVGVLDIKPGMTGLEVKLAADSVSAKAIPAEEFLKTGGGNKVGAEAKKKMREELLAKGAKTRERLEKESTVSGEGTAGPDADEIDTTTDALNKGADKLKRRRKGEAEPVEPEAVPAPPPRAPQPMDEVAPPRGEDPGVEEEEEEEQPPLRRAQHAYDTPSDEVFRGQGSGVGGPGYDPYAPKEEKGKDNAYDPLQSQGDDSEGGASETEEQSPLRREQHGYDTPPEDVLRGEAPTGDNYSTFKPSAEEAETESEEDATKR